MWLRERFQGARTLAVALSLLPALAIPLVAESDEPASSASSTAASGTADAAATEASSGAQPSDLGRQILERFEVRTEDSALILEPKDRASAVRTIEVEDDEVLVNGKRFDEDELEGFLGKDGELVRRLVDLDEDERLETLGMPEIRRRNRRDSGGVDISVPLGVGPRIHVKPSGDERVSIGHSIHLEEHESASNVVCIGCSVQIDGHDSGDAVAIGGSVRINGTVEGSAVSVGGSVSVADGGLVEGDGVSVGGTVTTDGSGEIEGEHVGVGIGGIPWAGGFGAWPWGVFSDASRLLAAVMKTGVLALLAALAYLLARPAVDAGAARVAAEPWKAAFAGLLAQLLVGPIFILVIVVLCISIIGIPLLLLIPFAILALFLGWFVGFVAVARSLGSWLEERFGWSPSTSVLSVVVGVVLIQATSLLGRAVAIPGGFFGPLGFSILALGFLLKYLAWTIGLGAMTLIALSGDWRRPSTVFAAPRPIPPPSPDIDNEPALASDPAAPLVLDATPATRASDEDEVTKS